MKNIFLVLVLAFSVSVSLSADIHIKSNFTKKLWKSAEKSYTQEISFDFCLKGTGDCMTFVSPNDKFKITYAIFSETNKGFKCAIELFEKDNSGEFALVCNPMLVVAWGKEAVVCFGKKNADGVELESRKFTVIAHKHEDDAHEAREEVVAEEAVTQEIVSEIVTTEEVVVTKEMVSEEVVAQEVVREQSEVFSEEVASNE